MSDDGDRKRSFLGVRVAIGSVKHLLQCSPLARGNRDPSHIRHRVLGPIPARAGQPGRWLRGAACRWAYPRSRGATLIPRGKVYFDPGLSPLARGNPLRASRAGSPSGPIPARAGQPSSSHRPIKRCRAYPRSRGATLVVARRYTPAVGLSPLARGNRRPCRCSPVIFGPIPARAGQPGSINARAMAFRAYPRSRGATWACARWSACAGGLSPLARGNLYQQDSVNSGTGPIPARAGQPPPFLATGACMRAYPRSRGATLHGDVLGLAARGPIPARAGQPSSTSRGWIKPRAYPRSRGATRAHPSQEAPRSGLSPLARGNQCPQPSGTCSSRPIPARAGQPCWFSMG